MRTWIVLAAVLLIGSSAGAASVGIWVNSGEDKVAREELRLTKDRDDVRNAIWDGRRVSLVAARGETVAFNVVIESPQADVLGMTAVVSDLIATDSDGQIRSTTRDDADGLFDYRDREIEIFFVRYLQIRGCSTLSYEHFDERHVPSRFRRPHDGEGYATGGWQDRPDHDRHYPDIAVPIELEQRFSIDAGSNQSLWVDVFVPNDTPPGDYEGQMTLAADNVAEVVVPVQLRVLPLELPDLPSARTMLYVSREDIQRRYVGKKFLDGSDANEALLAEKVVDRHFQMAHRHRVSLITEHTAIGAVDEVWRDKLDGSLFTRARGYDGPGIGVGNNVFSIGTYGTWPWRDNGRDVMWKATDRWMKYFDEADFETPTDPFLYLIDESDDVDSIETWSKWVLENPGPGRRLPTLATLPMPLARRETPSLGIACSTVSYGVTDDWHEAWRHYASSDDKTFFLYNGGRIGSGSLATEDDGVALRTLPWCQFKFAVPRWFIWQGTYYENFQGGTGETRLYSSAHTFGGDDRFDPQLGRTGGNYNNGDGVLFYPGTDRIYPDESYGVAGPLASLRLKHWRRGLQDFEYLRLAAGRDPAAVDRIVKEMVPKVLWEVGVSDPQDPSYVRGDIHWPTDPDRWHDARMRLIEIIGDGEIVDGKIGDGKIGSGGGP